MHILNLAYDNAEIIYVIAILCTIHISIYGCTTIQHDTYTKHKPLMALKGVE